MKTKREIVKAIVGLAVPIMLINLLQSAYQLTDAFWVGRLGDQAIAAVSVSTPILFLTTSLGVGFSIAGATLVSQYFGAKNQKMLSHSAAQTILMILCTSLVMSVIGYLLAPQILTWMGVEVEVFPIALQFLQISFLGVVANFIFFGFQSIMRGIGRPMLPMGIVAGTVLLNFLLDPLFIFGWGSIPAQGVSGAAWATLLTQSLAAFIGIAVLLAGKRGIHLHVRDFLPDWEFIQRSFWLALPSSVEQSSRSLGMTVMVALVTGFGTLALASYGVASNILQLLLMLGIGFSMANTVLIGQALGADNFSEAKQIARMGAFLSFFGIGFLSMLAVIFAPYLIAFFVPGEAAVIALGAWIVRIVASCYCLVGLHMALGGVFIASGKTKINLLLTAFGQWVVQIPLAYALSHYTPLEETGLWLAMSISTVVMAGMILVLFLSDMWTKGANLTRHATIQEKVSEEILIEEGIHS